MADHGLDRVAAEFNAVYVDLSALHRRLVTAASTGAEASDPKLLELLDRAELLTRAIREAGHTNGRPAAVVSPAEAEALALSAVVLRPPLDGQLLMAAFRTQPAPEAFGLVADALAQAGGARRAVWGSRMVADLLSAPRGMDLPAARRMADALGVEAHAAIADLAPDAVESLVAALRASARGART